MKTQKIKVMIVDDHLMVRKGLALLVNGCEDMNLVGEAEDSASAIKTYALTLPDVVLMDMVLPDQDGAATILEIRKTYPEAKIIALTSFTEDEIIESSLRAGARGFLVKTVGVEELANSIRIVHQGGTVFEPRASEVLSNMLTKSTQSSKVLFSDKEKLILRLLSNGLTNKQIASYLKVQPSTVKQYLSYIFSKLRVKSRTEAVTEGIRLNLIKK